MGFEDSQQWIKENAPKYLGNMVEFMHQLSLQVADMDLADLSNDALVAVKSCPASTRDIATVDAYRSAFARQNPDTHLFYNFLEATGIISLSSKIKDIFPPDFPIQKATQFNEDVLKVIATLEYSDDQKIIMLNALGCDRSNAIVANAEIYKYHPEMALADPMEQGPWLK